MATADTVVAAAPTASTEPRTSKDDEEAALPATSALRTEGEGSSSWWSIIASKAESLLVPCKPIICPVHLFPGLGFSFSCSSVGSSNSTVIGTILCDAQGGGGGNIGLGGGSIKSKKVKVCFQEEQVAASASSAAPPYLILDLPISANCELDGGPCRIVLECERAHSGGGPLLGAAAWMVYLNGRRVGFAWKREADDNDAVRWALQSLRAVSAGIGILPPTPTPSPATSSSSNTNARHHHRVDVNASSSNNSSNSDCGRIMEYFRGRFQRVVGSPDSESYHLIDPAGCLAHELSFFFVRL